MGDQKTHKGGGSLTGTGEVQSGATMDPSKDQPYQVGLKYFIRWCYVDPNDRPQAASQQ